MIRFFRDKASVRRLDELKKLSLFVDLSAREMSIVDAFMHERNYMKGEIVFDEGEEGQAIYFVLGGRVLICPQGQVDTPIALLGPGGFFGELALLDDTPRAAQARAAENTILAVLFRGDFLGLMHSHAFIASKIAFQLARHLGGRLRSSIRSGQTST